MLDDFIKLHWLVMLAEQRPGENPLLCYDDGGDGGGGGDDGGDDGGEGGDGGDDGAGGDDAGGDDAGEGGDGEGDEGDFGGEEGADLGGFDDVGSIDDAVADIGAEVSSFDEAGFTDAFGGFGGPVDALTEMQEQQSQELSQEFTQEFTSPIEEQGREAREALVGVLTAKEQRDQEKAEKEAEKEGKEEGKGFGAFAQATPAQVAQAKAATEVTPTGTVVGQAANTVSGKAGDQVGAPAPGTPGVPGAFSIGPGLTDINTGVMSLGPIDVIGGPLTETTPGTPSQAGSFPAGMSPTDVAFGYSGAPYGQTTASSPDMTGNAYVDANFGQFADPGNRDALAAALAGQNQQVAGAREVGTTSYTQDPQGNVIEAPTVSPTSIASQPTGPQEAAAVPSATGLLTDPLSGPPTGRAAQFDKEMEGVREAAREAAPDPNAPQQPGVAREPNALENFTGQLTAMLGGQQTGGFDPGGNMGDATSSGGGGLAGGSRGLGTSDTSADASPLLAAAAAQPAAVATVPPPTHSVNPTPYVPVQPTGGMPGSYAATSFDVAPERGYPAPRQSRASLRDAIAAALLAQTQDRLV